MTWRVGRAVMQRLAKPWPRKRSAGSIPAPSVAGEGIASEPRTASGLTKGFQYACHADAPSPAEPPGGWLRAESSLPWLVPWGAWTNDQLGLGWQVANQNPGEGWGKLRDEIAAEIRSRAVVQHASLGPPMTTPAAEGVLAALNGSLGGLMALQFIRPDGSSGETTDG